MKHDGGVAGRRAHLVHGHSHEQMVKHYFGALHLVDFVLLEWGAETIPAEAHRGGSVNKMGVGLCHPEFHRDVFSTQHLRELACKTHLNSRCAAPF